MPLLMLVRHEAAAGQQEDRLTNGAVTDAIELRQLLDLEAFERLKHPAHDVAP